MLLSLHFSQSLNMNDKDSLKRVSNGHYQGIDSCNQTWTMKNIGTKKWKAENGSNSTIIFPSRTELRKQIEILFGNLKHPDKI